MIPYKKLAEIIKEDRGEKTFREEWIEFANWEALRYFHDDPSRRSKDAIRWLQHFHELYAMIENDYTGPGKQRCLDAMETAMVAFSQLDLPDEMCDALEKWHAYRMHEAEAEDEPTVIGEDLLQQD